MMSKRLEWATWSWYSRNEDHVPGLLLVALVAILVVWITMGSRLQECLGPERYLSNTKITSSLLDPEAYHLRASFSRFKHGHSR